MHAGGRKTTSGSRPWPAVVLTFALLSFASGLTFYAWPVYFDELVARGFTLRDVSTSLTCFFIVNAVTSLAVARLVDRFDTRTVLLSGTLVCSVALAVLPKVVATWQLLLVFGVLGLGSAASTLVAGTTYLLRRLNGRSWGLTVGMTGLSVGGVLIAPGVAAVVEQRGLPDSALFIGLAYLISVGLPAAMMTSRAPTQVRVASALPVVPTASAPADGGPINPGGDAPALVGAAATPAYARATMLSPTFAVLAGAAAVMLCNHLGPQIHLIHLAQERGVGNAVFLISTVAGSSLVSRGIGAWLLAKLPTMYVFALIGVVQTGSLVLFAVSTSTPGLAVGAAMTGFCIGNLSVVMPLVVLEYYGVEHYPRMFGAQQLIVNLGTALGPSLIAVLHDSTGGYGHPMVLLAVMSGGATGCIVWFVRRYGLGADSERASAQKASSKER